MRVLSFGFSAQAEPKDMGSVRSAIVDDGKKMSI